MKKAYLLFLALFAFTIFGTSPKANAQAAYAGNYNMIGGYTTGLYWQGLYFKGYATATRTGAVVYTVYFPYSGFPSYGNTYRGSGRITSSGLFYFVTRGVYGTVQLLLQKYGFGYFYDLGGSGYFVLSKL